MELLSVLQNQLKAQQQTERFNFNLQGLDWVCGMGFHEEVWQVAIVGSFENCFDWIWGVLQHEVSMTEKQFASKLRKNHGYTGKFGEIKKISKKPKFTSGMSFNNAIFIFDYPEETYLGLSKAVKSMIHPCCKEVVFGQELIVGLKQNKLHKQLSRWEDLTFMGEYTFESSLESIDVLKLSNYPLLVTSSPFILAKAVWEGLLCCFVPNILSLVNNPPKYELPGIHSRLYEWLKPFPKNVYFLDEKLRAFHKDSFYSENPQYKKSLPNIIDKLNSACHSFGANFDYLNLENKTPGEEIVKTIKQKERDNRKNNTSDSILLYFS